MSPKPIAALFAVLLLAVSLTACSSPKPEPPITPTTQPDKPTTNPPAGTTETLPGDVDVAVRKTLQGYLDALNRKAYDQADTYWSKITSVQHDVGKTPGVSNWYFISSEMVDNTADTARVQLNFEVNVAPGTTAPYANGRNVLYIRLRKEQDGWKIMSMSPSP